MVAAAVGIGSAVAGIAGSAMSSSASSSAAQAQENAANTASANQMAMFNKTQANEQPYMTAGSNALGQLSSLYGLNGAPANTSILTNSPNYQFAFNQGENALDQSAAAKGNLFAGGYGQDLVNYGQGMASQQLGALTNTLMGISSSGQNAASMTGQQGANAANISGQDSMNGANAYGTGQINSANAWMNGLGQAVNGTALAMGYNGNNSMSQIPTGGISDFTNYDLGSVGGGFQLPTQPTNVLGTVSVD
jgi:hypothetical protein